MGFLKAIDHCMVFQLHDDPPRFENRIVRENIPRDAASVIFERAASVSPDYRKVWGHLDGTEKPVQMAFDAFTKLVKDLKPK